MRHLFGPTIILVTALAQTPVYGKGIELDSREYKMMLQKDHFGGSTPKQAVDGFILDQLVPAVRLSFGGKAADQLRTKGLDPKEHRLVRFWDTDSCGLSGHGFALRDRVDLDPHDQPVAKHELTLKFRSPDLFLAADMRLHDPAGDDLKSKFEEDIGALAVRNKAGGSMVAAPPSSRSQFSRSFKRTVDAGQMPHSLNEVERLYGGFKDTLRLMAGAVDLSAALGPTPDYRELVYESSNLDVAADAKAKFALTIWYKGADNHDVPTLAEISFSYATDDGAVAAEAARRARDLLLALQGLAWADPAAPTKTALVDCVD